MSDLCQDLPDEDLVSFAYKNFFQYAGSRGRHVKSGLIRNELDEVFAFFNGVTGRLVPIRHVRLCNAFG